MSCEWFVVPALALIGILSVLGGGVVGYVFGYESHRAKEPT